MPKYILNFLTRKGDNKEGLKLLDKRDEKLVGIEKRVNSLPSLSA
jgi:hypothetical protein